MHKDRHAVEKVRDRSSTDRMQLIERHIQQRTHGRVHNLAVGQQGGDIVVTGLTQAYYVKQLAQASLKELDLPADTLIRIEIDVRTPRTRQDRRYE